MEYKNNKKQRSVHDVEDHRARICLDKICEFMRKDGRGIQSISLLEFQQWIGKQINTPNENPQYELYQKYKKRLTLYKKM
jgi:hypothetical protein